MCLLIERMSCQAGTFAVLMLEQLKATRTPCFTRAGLPRPALVLMPRQVQQPHAVYDPLAGCAAAKRIIKPLSDFPLPFHQAVLLTATLNLQTL